MKKITRKEFDTALADIVTDLTMEAVKKGAPGTAMGLMIVGAEISAKLGKALFEEDTELEIITDKE
jgi:hypothetical protein